MKSFESYLTEFGEIGFVEEVVDTLVYVRGLPTVKAHELVVFESGEYGQVLSLSADLVEILLLSKSSVVVGTRVVRTNTYLSIPVGDFLRGGMIDALGNMLLEQTTVSADSVKTRPIHNSIPGLARRKKIKQHFETGVTLVDMLLPLGKGQRELVIGDRKTGKTSFLLKCLLHQAQKGTICIYAAVGKKKLDIKQVEEFIQENNISKNVVMVVSSSQDPIGMIYLTPYTAMTIAEYFRDLGKDVLVVLDDLLVHARFYRELSLLAKRFPGRNSYPSDMFFTHASLLERAGNFIDENGVESSITCLPAVETISGDLTGYVQTNLMSMTDGHIFFDTDLFGKGRRPAINPFLSVTRVGRQTQTSLDRQITREIMSFLTIFEKTQRFVHFGQEVGPDIKRTLDTGERIHAFFDQGFEEVLEPHLQIFLFGLLWYGTWQSKSTEQMKEDMKYYTKLYRQNQQFQQFVGAIIQKSNSFNEVLKYINQSEAALTQMKGAQ